jgi:hypothetical protein
MQTLFTLWMNFLHVQICITDLYDCVNHYTVILLYFCMFMTCSTSCCLVTASRIHGMYVCIVCIVMSYLSFYNCNIVSILILGIVLSRLTWWYLYSLIIVTYENSTSILKHLGVFYDVCIICTSLYPFVGECNWKHNFHFTSRFSQFCKPIGPEQWRLSNISVQSVDDKEILVEMSTEEN